MKKCILKASKKVFAVALCALVFMGCSSAPLQAEANAPQYISTVVNQADQATNQDLSVGMNVSTVNSPLGFADNQTQDYVGIRVNGRMLQQSDNYGFAYINEDNRTIVPVRFVLEAMGLELEWFGDTQDIHFFGDGQSVWHGVGSQTATSQRGGGDIIANIDTVSYIDTANNRTMVSARLIAEAFGADVGFDGATRTVIITTSTEDDNYSDAPITSALPQGAALDVLIAEQWEIRQNTDFTDANRFFQVLVSTAPHQVDNAFNFYEREIREVVDLMERGVINAEGSRAQAVLRPDGTPVPFDVWMEWRLLGWTWGDISDGGPAPGQQPNTPRN